MNQELAQPAQGTAPNALAAAYARYAFLVFSLRQGTVTPAAMQVALTASVAQLNVILARQGFVWLGIHVSLTQ